MTMRSCITAVLGTLQVCAAVGLISIVLIKLEGAEWSKGWREGVDDLVRNRQCMLGVSQGQSLCTYAYYVSGVSLLATSVISIVKCCTCDLCGLGIILDIFIGSLGVLWWVVASIIFTRNASLAHTAKVPLDNWRLAVTILSWTSVALFGLMLLAALISIFRKTCKALSACCDCCFDDDDEEKGSGKYQRVSAHQTSPYPPTQGQSYLPQNDAGPPPGYPPVKQFVVGH